MKKLKAIIAVPVNVTVYVRLDAEMDEIYDNAMDKVNNTEDMEVETHPETYRDDYPTIDWEEIEIDSPTKKGQ